VCGSEIEKRMFRIVVPHWQGTFDCVECALTVADRGESGAGPLSQAEELAAELFVARLAGASHGSESLRTEIDRLTAELEEERLRARELERERDNLARQLELSGRGPASRPGHASAN
jgi:predicted RNase H-like nuclease (RuvC/YqgF family)